MGVIEIRSIGDPVLRQPARDVEAFDESLRRLAEDMFETMFDAPGVGLAAPQIGLSLRFFVFDSGHGDSGAIANPMLSELEGEIEEDEGCLSIRGLYWPRKRFMHARLDGLDLDGRPLTLWGEDLLARIFQHETDHTNGMLFIDGLAEEERRKAMAEFRAMELDPTLRGRRSE